MLLVSGNKNSYCPYRDCLGIDTGDGRISWYQLLGVSQASTVAEMQHRYESRRALVLKNRKSTFHPVWENLLDELDRALGVLTDPERKQAYDEDLLRRNRQSSMCRLPSEDAEEWKAAMHARKLAKGHQNNESNNSNRKGVRDVYEPLRMIGDGSRGTRVYEAWEYNLNRRVAVKCLLRSARTPKRCKSFIEEAQFIASVSHPNLAEVHTISTRGCFVVMEYLPETLATHIAKQKKHQCSIEFTKTFLTQSLSILKRLHSAGVVHGGLNRNSFHLTETGTIKLTDAPGCTVDGLFQVPKPEQTCIAPELLSPETFGEPGFAVDLYMVGFMAFELLAGDLIEKWIPKLGQQLQSDQAPWAQWHASPLEHIPSLEAVLPEIPAELAFVIETLCEKQVLDRFRSADDALSKLALPSSGAVPDSNKSNPEVRRSLQARPARQIGGDAPLVLEAKKANVQEFDLLETLQDPKLIWERFRTDRKFRFSAIGLCCLFAMLCLASGSSGSTTAGTGTAAMTERSETQDQLEYPWEADSEASSLPLIRSMKQNESATVDSDDELYADSQKYVPVAAELEPAPSPIQLNSLLTTNSTPKTGKRPADMAIETIRPFPVLMHHDNDYPKLVRCLRHLQNTSDGTTRRAIFQELCELAPQDPRIWFLFAAATSFKPEVRDELMKAVELSDREYTQPLRQLIECQLMDLEVTPAANADRVLARLIELANRLRTVPHSSQQQYDWEWIGRVIAYLELQGHTDAKISEMLAVSRPRILNTAGPDGTAGIQRGRTFVLAASHQTPLADFFPNQPRTAFTLCLESIIAPQTQSRSPSTSTAATPPIPVSATMFPTVNRLRDQIQLREGPENQKKRQDTTAAL